MDRGARPASPPGSRWLPRLLAVAGVLALVGALVAAVRLGTSTSTAPPETPPAAAGTKAPAASRAGTAERKPAEEKPAKAEATTRPAAALVARRLVGVGAFDPDGDRRENDDLAALATDGDPSTAWRTERYRSFAYKSGVGLVLDLGAPARLARLVVTTETPGFEAEVRAGDSPERPFAPVSASRIVAAQTAFALQEHTPARYRVLWITKLGGGEGGLAEVNEVRALARGG